MLMVQIALRNPLRRNQLRRDQVMMRNPLRKIQQGNIWRRRATDCAGARRRSPSLYKVEHQAKARNPLRSRKCLRRKRLRGQARNCASLRNRIRGFRQRLALETGTVLIGFRKTTERELASRLQTAAEAEPEELMQKIAELQRQGIGRQMGPLPNRQTAVNILSAARQSLPGPLEIATFMARSVFERLAQLGRCDKGHWGGSGTVAG